MEHNQFLRVAFVDTASVDIHQSCSFAHVGCGVGVLVDDKQSIRPVGVCICERQHPMKEEVEGFWSK